jgi:tripartite-type tricarboxylate transporter receptor subunit TctC
LLEKSVKETMADPAVVASLRKIGVTPWLGTADDLGKAVVTDTVKWGKIIKRAGIQAQ